MVNPVGGTNPVSENNYDPSQKTLTDYNTAISDLNANPPNYPGAYAAFKDILDHDKIFPTQHPEIYYYAGLAAEYSGDPSAMGNAKLYLQEYLKVPKPDPDMLKSAKGQIDMIDGQDAMNSNDYPAALAAFQKACVDDPSLSSGLQSTIGQIKGQIDIQNADAAQQQGDLAGMIKWYEQAAQDCPSMAPELASTITQLKAEQSENQAVNALMSQAQNNPDPNQAIETLQSIYAQYPDTVKNVPSIAIMIAQNQAHLVMNPPNGAQGHPEEAIAILQAVCNEHPNTVMQQFPSMYYTMAQYAWGSGHVEQAKAYFAKFEPTISSIPVQGNEQFLAAVAYFNQQLNGANSKMANWATYAADWLGQHTPVKTEWWLNNVLGAAQGVMFNTDGMNHINAKSRFGKHAFIYHQHQQGSSNELESLKEQLRNVNKALANERDPQKLEALRGQVSQLTEEIKSVKNAQDKGFENLTPENQTARTETRSYQNGINRKTTIQTADSEDTKDAAGNVTAKGEGAIDDPSGPGFWGLGTTLQQAQACYKTFGTVNTTLVQSNPDAGLADYTVQASGGVNALNAEERLFNMCYGGPTAAGLGIHDMYGAQARADLVDEQYGLSYFGGDTTIGGQTFSVAGYNALATGSASESGAIGAQVDAHGGASLGTHGVDLAGNTGAFAGAQASGQVAGNILGQGGFVMGQAWAGVGAKLNANVGYTSGNLHFTFGVGAALGVGGYLQLSGNLNFEAMGQEVAAIYGTGNHSFVGMASRTGELAGDGVSATGAMVEHTAKDVDSLVGKAQDYLAANAANNVFHADNAKQFFTGVGEGVGELATDAADIAAPEFAVGIQAAKQIGKLASDVGSDIAHGEIGDAIKDTVEDTAEGAWDIVKDTAETAWHAVKNFFNWL